MSFDMATAETLVARYPARTVRVGHGAGRAVSYREAGSDRAGGDRAGGDRAGSDRAGSGRADSGRADSGPAGARVGTPASGLIRAPIVVLLHGIGSQSGSWVLQMDSLARQFRVIAWDAPGYGGSDPLDIATPAAAHYADILGGFLDALGATRAVLVASSLGALMAGALAARRPGLVAGLVLLNPAPGYGLAAAREREEKLAARLDRLDRLGPAGMARELSPGMLSDNAPPEAQALAAWSTSVLRPDGYRQAAHMLAGGRLIEDAARYAGPVSVIAGSADTITPPAGCEAVARAFPHAGFRVLAGVGHLSYLDAAEKVSGLIAAFADKHLQPSPQ
jgi:pimeloyl-ACP methyl ester carboxylesterase